MTQYPEIRLKKSSLHYDLYEVVEDCFVLDLGVTIPKGFRTDFSSVPQWLWWLIPPHGKAAMASVIHDYLYEIDRSLTRSEADKDFLIRLISSDVPIIQSVTMYSFVRLFGAKNWNLFRRN